jgi:AraC-like DNA-binding protein
MEERMFTLFEEKKLYLEPRLSLTELAQSLNTTTHKLSEVINGKPGRTFYDIVNDYRVQHLRNLLSDSKQNHLTILALGLESGFNSKASMNRIFKNITGVTPNQYRKESLNRSFETTNKSQMAE